MTRSTLGSPTLSRPALASRAEGGLRAAPATQGSVRSLWLAVGVLGASTLALAGVLLAQTLAPRPAPAPQAVAQLAAPASAEPAWELPPTSAGPSPLPATRLPAAGKATVVVGAPAVAKAQASAVTSTAESSVTFADASSATAPSDVPASTYTRKPPAARLQAGAVCVQCGVVESVTEVERAAQTSGAGAVLGGLAGALVGNQIGKGEGRTAATLLGAAGGAVVGNALEQRARRERVYEVRVRMDDGSLNIVEQSSAPQVGERVTLESGTLSPVAPQPAGGFTQQPRPARGYSTV